ncbi:DNA helicase [Shinella sp. SUS2]|uniref:replicative DNA helicase n=1 Tax=unclassified Shinella TaxID=2643062 RepID=UPI0006811B06|nr:MULTISPECIES: DnaB-like helicase C-terminal domain-containing protein [unclassified Shinella]KNY13107.1 DNA helicase [Shinella sp. SUS2]KOC71892.1 DNA helicase [Shinella sp. GWS1]
MNAHVMDANAFVPEIEQNVLGAILLGGDIHETLSILKEYHFVEAFHREVYRSALAAHERYGSSNPSIVKRLLDEQVCAEFEKSTGMQVSAYLARLVSSATASGSGTAENARKVLDQWARISIAGEAGRVHAAANDPSADAKVVASEAAKNLDDIISELRAGGRKKTRVSVGGAAMRAVEAAQAAREKGSGLTGITWGLTDLNRMTGGIQRRDLTLIGARPSMGKTTVALSCAIKAAQAGHCCGIVSLEMDADKLASRALSDIMFDWRGKVPYTNIVRGEVSDSDIDAIMEAQIELDRLPLHIDEQAGQTATDIRVRAERMAEERAQHGTPLEVLFIDHLGLIRPSSRYSGNRVNEIAEITSSMKSLARELDIAVVLLSQLSRALESRDEKRPMLSDLRDSGAIEQDADMIAFLFREAYYLERAQGGSFEEQAERADKLIDCQNKLEFIIAKQRNGPLGTVDLFADMAFSAVRNGARQ